MNEERERLTQRATERQSQLKAYIIASRPHALLDYTDTHFLPMEDYQYLNNSDFMKRRDIPVIVLEGHGKPGLVEEVRAMGFTLVERTMDRSPGI